MDSAPEMAAVRHVALLTLESQARGRARPPFREGVLEELTVEGEARGRGLMAAPAELRPEKRRRPRHAVVGQTLSQSRRVRDTISPGRSKALMPSDVAACAHEPLGLQRGVKGRVRSDGLLSGLRGLFG